MRKGGLSNPELFKMWEIYVLWKTAQNESGADIWEAEGQMDGEIALELMFQNESSDELVELLGAQVYWFHPETRNVFFDGLAAKNPSSKFLLKVLPYIGKAALDGISIENFENLKACKYFKESMLESAGITINEDEE